MTSGIPEYSEFADLRRVAIDYAQRASGEIWTDYNLHDPGVTLLEQSCFALSELAYQTAHPDRDLLTDARGRFNFQDLALFPPRKVLATDPVTMSDLAAWLSECPRVARVLVSPAGRDLPGLFDLVVVPAADETPNQDLIDTVARAFDRVRPICCDRNTLGVARRRKVRLTGQVEMMPDLLPEVAAAQIYYAVSNILRGVPQHAEGHGATREDVYDAPQMLLHRHGDEGPGRQDLDDHLGELQALPAVRDIGLLALEMIGPPPEGEGPFYRSLQLPRTAEEIGLVLTLGGAAVALDPTRLYEEFVRVSAERMGHSTHHIDAADWQVMRPGQRRDFTHHDVDNLLPIIYRAALLREAGSTTGLAAYRQAVDGHLASMARDLADLPEFFAADAGLPTHDPQDWRHKLALLDYLIALQGEEMPATRHTGLHHYLGTRARHRFELDWRLRYLYALPRLNAARLTGPNPRSPGGFMGRLCLLADLAPDDGSGAPPILRRYGLRIDEPGDSGSQTVDDATLRMSGPPLFDRAPADMLGSDDDAPPLSPEELRDLCPWIAGGRLSSARFLRLAQADCLHVVPVADRWAVLFEDTQDAAPLRLAEYDDLQAARTALSRLRTTWRMLHAASDTAVLVEDILLRDEQGYRPHCACLVLNGWTARGALSAYRHYVENLIHQHAPAHLLIRAVWLSHAQSLRFSALSADVHVRQAGAGAALRAFLDAAGDGP